MRNMQAMAMLSQDEVDGSNTITFNKSMQYEAFDGATETEFYLTLPYRSSIANGQLGRQLRANLTAFAEVELYRCLQGMRFLMIPPVRRRQQ